ncbi:hypothetical protein ACFTSE_09975 [Bacillus cereus]
MIREQKALLDKELILRLFPQLLFLAELIKENRILLQQCLH